MPFIEDKSVGFLERAQGLDEIDVEERPVSFSEELTAAYRLENTLGSFIAKDPNLPTAMKTTDFDAWSQLTDDEKLNKNFVEAAVGVENELELNAVRNQMDRENRDRSTLKNSYLAPFLMGVSDPINFIPTGGVAYKTYKTGGSILRNAVATSSVAAGTTALTEAALHQTQMTRTMGESAANITAAVFLGGILGAAPGAIEKLILKTGRKPQEVFDEIDLVMDPEKAIADGGNPTMFDRSIGAAEVNNDAKVRGKLARAATKFIGFDPWSATATSDAKATRSAVNSLAESPLDMDRPLGQAVETAIKLHDGKFFDAVDGHMNTFKAYKEGGGELTRREFGEAVGKAVRNGSDDPHIQGAADSWNTKLYEPLKKDFVEVGLLPADVDVKTAAGYLNRIWSKPKVAGNLSSFVEKTKGWLDEQNTKKLAVQSDVERLSTSMMESQTKARSLRGQLDSKNAQITKASKQLEEVQRAEKASIQRAFKTKDKGITGKEGRRKELSIAESRQRTRSNELQDRISGLKHSIDELETRISKLDEDALARVNDLEVAVADWPGKSGNKVRAAIRSRDSVLASKASKELLAAVRKLNNIDIDAIDTESLAMEIAGRIMGTPDGRLPYDYKIGENSSGGVSNNLSGPFQKRSFAIPDELMEEFLENDIEVLGARYIKSTAPDLELMRRYDDVEMKSELKDIEQEWLKRIKDEPDSKKALKLEKQKDKDIKNISAMRDRLRGTFGQVDHTNPWVRAARVARDLNYMRLLGGVVASSFSDVARIVAAEGIQNTFKNALVPMVTKMGTFKIAAHEAKLWGVGTDSLMGGRAEILADVADYAAGGNAFERGVRSAATKFSSINLMNQWTGGMKQLHAVAMQTRIIPELRAGKIDRRLNQLGIDDANAKNIALELKNHAEEIDGVWIANARAWENQELAMMWAGAVRKESDRVIIIPGQEKPLFMSTELGKTIGQFKTFMFSATQRILLSTLQQQDSHYIQGVMSMLSLGMMTYAFKQWDAGRELSDDPAVWIAEGIDRSGMIGILMEANNTIEKVSQNSMGIRPLLGINAPASRYASRSILDSMAGPTFGLMGTVAQVAGGISGEREWDKSDTRALRRLLPGQNLSILRQGLDKIEEAAR
ncbi:MAG: hypothetical protein COB84_01970 [Rhodobacteraceae bacterium]|nr:MAG: hypothetical protein COB84_01970 [Paracoccaceae bacterium]